MSIHTNNRDIVLKFAAKPASRILVNTGGSQGGTGISTGLPISFTLGCGTSGGSSVSDNVSPKNLLNIKKVAYGLKDVTTLVEDDKSFHIGSHEPVKEKACLTQKNNCSSESIDMEELTKVVRNVLMGMKD
jgi:acetaldehyde dehydrogenase (acetylating)